MKRDELDYLIQRVCNSRRQKTFDGTVAWRKVQVRISHRKRPAVYLRWIGYAACILAVLTGIWLANDTPEAQVRTPFVQHEPYSSPAKVELTLANGKSVDLDDIDDLHEEELGISITRDSASKQLSYHCQQSAASSEVHYNRLAVPHGADFSFELPDGTFVALNSESVLCFPVQFAPDERTVYLEGEAYFKVTRNEKAPFKVITDGRQITVLGTKFCISSYADDAQWSATLVEGKVAVSDHGRSYVLQPSEQYVADKRTGQAEVRQVNTELYTSWLNGKLHFKDCRLEEIIRKLERWYDFTVTYQDESLKELKFRGVIDKDCPLQKTLHLLEETKAVLFEIRGEAITVKKK